MSTYDTPDSNDKVENERVNRQIAEDVAVGEAARADAASVRAEVESARASAANSRANAYAQNYVAKSVEAADARLDRDAAVVSGAVANEQARNASAGFWLLLGIMVVALAVGALWYANRPAQPLATTTVINREMPAAPTATAAPAAGSAAVTTVPVPVPVPVPNAASSAPSHTTNNVNVYPPASSAASASKAANNAGGYSGEGYGSGSASGSQPLHGYVEPSGASPAAAPAANAGDANSGGATSNASGGQ